jgi:TetR/AcrR family transcriptional regulator, cholesterol catabolism regulator
MARSPLKANHERTSKSRAAKKLAILHGAAEVFALRGFVAGTTTEIARKVDLSQSAVYYYVGSKNDLLQEISLQVDQDMAAALERGLAAASPAERMRTLVSEVIEAVVRDRWSFMVYWRERDRLPDDVRKKIERDERQFVAAVQGLVEDLQAAGKLPADAPASILTRGILGMVTWVYQWYRPNGKFDSPEIAQTFLQLIGLADGD